MSQSQNPQIKRDILVFAHFSYSQHILHHRYCNTFAGPPCCIVN